MIWVAKENVVIASTDNPAVEEVTHNPMAFVGQLARHAIDHVNWVEVGFFVPVVLAIVMATLVRRKRSRGDAAAKNGPVAPRVSEPAQILINRIQQGIDRCGMFTAAADKTEWREIVFEDRMVRVRTTADGTRYRKWQLAVADESAAGGWKFLVGAFPTGDDSQEIVRAADAAFDAHLAKEAVAGLAGMELDIDKDPCDCESTTPAGVFPGEHVTSVRVTDDGRLRVATANPPDVSYYRLPSYGPDESQIQRIVSKELVRHGGHPGLSIEDVRQLAQETAREAMEARPPGLSASETMKLVQGAVQDACGHKRTEVTVAQARHMIGEELRAMINGDKFRDAVLAVAAPLVARTVRVVVDNTLAVKELERKATAVKISEPAKPESIDYDKITAHFADKKVVYEYVKDNLETGAVVTGLPSMASYGGVLQSGKPDTGTDSGSGTAATGTGSESGTPTGGSSESASPASKPEATTRAPYRCMCHGCVLVRSHKAEQAKQQGS